MLEGYARWGGWRYHGWFDYSDGANYLGPTIWTEADAVFRLALELEREFPMQVHCELSLNKATRHDHLELPPGYEKAPRWAVDIVVSDMHDFPVGPTSQETFRTRTHAAFIEAKWFKKGWRDGTFKMDAHKQLKGVGADLTKLAFNLKLRRCSVAAMLIVDDENFFEDHGGDLEWPEGVEPLVLSPRMVEEHQLAASYSSLAGSTIRSARDGPSPTGSPLPPLCNARRVPGAYLAALFHGWWAPTHRSRGTSGSQPAPTSRQ